MTTFQIVAFYMALNLILACILILRVGTQRTDKKVIALDPITHEVSYRIVTRPVFRFATGPHGLPPQRR